MAETGNGSDPKAAVISEQYHRWRSRASPVLTAISLVNGKPWEPVIFDPTQNRHTLTDR